MRKHSSAKSKFNSKRPLTSLLNYASVRLCYFARTERVIGYPSKILFEPTSSCNLKCPLCPTGRGTLNRSDGVMSFDRFKQIVDEIKPYTTQLELAGYGEPFLNENICKMAKYAADAGIFVNMHSNVLLIDTPQKVHDLITSGVRFLTVSIDGAKQDTYRRYRVGGQLEVALANLKALVDEKKRLGLRYPIIECQTVVTRINEAEVDDVRRIAEEIGVDQYFAKKASLALTRPAGSIEIAKGIVDR